MSDDKVVSLPVETKLPIPVDKVLAGALQTHAEDPLDRVLVVGVFKDGVREFFASSEPDSGTLVWDMHRFERYLHKRADDELVSEG